MDCGCVVVGLGLRGGVSGCWFSTWVDDGDTSVVESVDFVGRCLWVAEFV